MAIGNTNYTLLLAKLRQHDLTAFDELFHRARKRLYVLAFSITGDSEAAKDVVQEFFIDFWLNRRYLHIEQSLEHYMLFAVRNRALKHVRNQASIERKKQMLPERFSKTVVTSLEQSELKKEMDEAIERLPPMAGKVFRLHYIEHLSHIQIAEQLGISKSTVSSHIDRALKELRNTLKYLKISSSG